MNLTPQSEQADNALAEELANTEQAAEAHLFEAPTADEVITALGNAVANFLELLDKPEERNVRVETLLKTPEVAALASSLTLGAQYVEAKAAYQAIVTKGLTTEKFEAPNVTE